MEVLGVDASSCDRAVLKVLACFEMEVEGRQSALLGFKKVRRTKSNYRCLYRHEMF